VSAASSEPGKRGSHLCMTRRTLMRRSVWLLGAQGLHAEEGVEARYRLTAGQPYVHARVSASSGVCAWLLPPVCRSLTCVRVRRRSGDQADTAPFMASRS
jgi:hypothetical protein